MKTSHSGTKIVHSNIDEIPPLITQNNKRLGASAQQNLKKPKIKLVRKKILPAKVPVKTKMPELEEETLLDSRFQQKVTLNTLV